MSSKKRRLLPQDCQPDQGPQLKKGTYLQAIDFFRPSKKGGTKEEESREVNWLKSLAGIKVK
jgi:hypothetical protein